jgi:muramoyltetrapeptide carboxypeptidase
LINFIDFHYFKYPRKRKYAYYQSWSINSSFSFLQSLIYFFCFTIIQQSSPNTHDSTNLQKEIPLPSWQQPENIDDNLRPAIDLLHSWGLEVIIGNTIGLDNNQLAGTDAKSSRFSATVRQSQY